MISVVMPAFNAQPYVAPAIESILGQTYRELELIVVDDGSTDATLDIAQCYAAQDCRVKVIAGEHQGPAAARNIGMAEAAYPWIAVMDSDDIALPDRLATQLAAAECDREVVVWGSGATYMAADGRPMSAFHSGPTSKAEFEAMRSCAHNVQVCHSTALYRRDLALRVGGYDHRFVCDDTEFFDRMALHGMLIALPDLLVKYRTHGASVTLRQYRRMKVQSRYVSDRQRRRLAGLPPISLGEFEAQARSAPPLARFRVWQQDTSNLSYIRARDAFGRGRRIEAAGRAMLAVLVNPPAFVPQVWRSIAAYRAVKMADGR